MSKEKLVKKYEAGEKPCSVCNKPLAEHQTWPGALFRFCGSTECETAIREMTWGRYVGPNEHKCENLECDRFVPPGRYRSKPAFLSCSAACWYRRSSRGNIQMKCDCGCGKEFFRASRRPSATGLVFLSPQHQGDYFSRVYVEQNCGLFVEIVNEYLKGFGTLHYRGLATVRGGLVPFFKYLGLQKIKSIDQVTPGTITSYLIWAQTSGHTNAPHNLWTISVFFKWALVHGHRKVANPVVGLIHNGPRKHYRPRPLSASEIGLMWELLGKRGSPRLRLAAAIGVESGLRLGEICRLRIEDVNVIQQTVFVGLPNKTNRERLVNCLDKTRRYYIEWMAERNADCGHDFLFHNTLGNPLKQATLADEFNRVLLKSHEDRSVNEIGFDQWSTHRLRHTMATQLIQGGADLQTVMAQGGWISADSTTGYAQVDEDQVRRGYIEAMRSASDQKNASPSIRILSATELLQMRKVRAETRDNFALTERCV